MLDVKEKILSNKDAKAVGAGTKKFPSLSLSYISTLLIPLGYSAFFLVNKIVSGDWFRYLEYQKNGWKNSVAPFPHAVVATINNMGSPDMRTIVNWSPQLIMFFIAALLTMAFIGKIRTSYVLYSFAFIYVPYSSSFLISGARYLVGAFPIFISLGLLTKNKNIDRTITMFFIMFMTILAICFTFDRNIL